MSFANPLYFLLLLLLVPFALWHFGVGRKRENTTTVADAAPFDALPKTMRSRLADLPFYLRMLAFTLLVCALARPQTHYALHERDVEGIDIMLAIDISTSMLTPDLQPTRLEAAKRVATEFVHNRPDDNIGLTLFGGEAFTQCPLTSDHAALLSMFRSVSTNLASSGTINQGTAIGMGIAAAVSHLEQSQAKSKVVILLTDGENNTGEISPTMAAEMAQKLGIRVYTILAGSDLSSQMAAPTLPGLEDDVQIYSGTSPETLQEIAKTTGGLFFQATGTDKLREIYRSIDQLEKTEHQVMDRERYFDYFQVFGFAAPACLLLEILLRLTWLRRIPE